MVLDIERVEANISTCERKVAACEEKLAINVAAQDEITTLTDVRGLSKPRRRLSAAARADLEHLRMLQARLVIEKEQLGSEKLFLLAEKERLNKVKADLESTLDSRRPPRYPLGRG